MTALALAKLHGTGNDFLILLDMEGRHPLTPQLARALCDRHRGVGADGVIRATRPGKRIATGLGAVVASEAAAHRLAALSARATSLAVTDEAWDVADGDGAGSAATDGAVAVAGAGAAPVAGAEDALLRFQLRNADGSPAEMSGNGMRCLAHAALDAGLVPAGEPFVVDTPAGPRTVTVRASEVPGTVWAVVEMGTARVTSDYAGAGRLRVDTGNPHMVILVDDPADVAVADIGARLDLDEPGGLNVEFVVAGPGRDQATMRVWERGVGETLACGTGSCAAVVALHHWGLVDGRVRVHQPGGPSEVTLGHAGSVTLAGPSQRIGLVTLQTEDLAT